MLQIDFDARTGRERPPSMVPVAVERDLFAAEIRRKKPDGATYAVRKGRGHLVDLDFEDVSVP